VGDHDIVRAESEGIQYVFGASVLEDDYLQAYIKIDGQEKVILGEEIDRFEEDLNSTAKVYNVMYALDKAVVRNMTS